MPLRRAQKRVIWGIGARFIYRRGERNGLFPDPTWLNTAETLKPCLFVVAVAGLVLHLTRAYPVVGVTKAPPGAILGLFAARDGFLDRHAGRYARCGVSQLRHAGD